MKHLFQDLAGFLLYFASVYFSGFSKRLIHIVSVSSHKLSNDMLSISARETKCSFLNCAS